MMRFENSFLYLMEVFYGLLIRMGNRFQSLFLLYMRLTWGHQFFLTGWGKLHAIERTATFFATLNIPHPLFNAYLVGYVECIGGICLMFGFASRLICIPLIINMITALSTAHYNEISHWRFITDPLSLVRQTPYPFLLTILLVFIFGPGRVSIDAWLKRWAQNRKRY